ncbi:MAG: DNA polymerase III subunit beta [Myxococcales bacterium]|jgi:DNA polymerase-3 subunit beta|nr:DNA polymerase III subunit beta [Myxococcales bacterium]
MRVAVSKKELLRVLGRCQGVADKKSTMPVLGNVLLETVGPNELRLAATDLYLAVSGNIEATIERPGAVALGARDLYERVKMMPDGQVTLEVNDGAATTIRAAGSARRYTVHGMPGDEFPSLPEPDANAEWLELEIAAMARLIAATHFSISTDETRLHLSSALFEWEGDRVRMVTTDGHRLSKMEIGVKGSEATASMLIPLKGVQELRRLCDEAFSELKDDETPKLSLVQSGPSVFFELAGFRFSVKLVDAQFPPYQQVIPAQSERAVRVPRNAFAEALKAVSLAASDRTGGVKLTLSPGHIRVESESPEAGEGFDEIDVDYDGPEVTIGFNAQYFLHVLAAMPDDEVMLGISGELDPAVLQPGSESVDRSYLAVVMPMRI